ncbi:MAG: phospho-N-acetylmuramoyl-pentapeptide-transferase [Clostridia bacterium]|nr:phospho-N-acetylmuramoyl-pentapeptide-transferase [Clostridia bacterium]
MKDICLALICAFVASTLLLLLILPLLRRLKAGQYILSYVKEHKNKSGTPTMGGLAFICAIIVVGFCFLGFSGGDANLTLAITASFMVVGFLDDFLKIHRKDNGGLRPYQKILFQISIAVVAAVYCYINGKTYLNVPFCEIRINVEWGIIPLVAFIFIATVNCVNLTDGLDGLAGGTCCGYLAILGVMLTLKGLDTALLCFIGVGAVAAFLVFNTNKAAIFMGDTGSLALGGFISCLSVFSDNSLYIPILGVMFVLSGISVIVQVIYYKRTSKRIFLMAPIHHHFQMKGYTECKISYCYFLITCLVGIFCLIFW